ncbi:MAG: glycine cleavage system protein GcvH [Rhodocyclaceae bacterium]|nr:glycine cleavage system protein GcvH [Rhodocyclaceae bacterium]
MELPENLKYTDSHEWVLDNQDGTVSVGITFHAQKLLGDVVFLDAAEVGSTVKAGDTVTVIESVKAASDIYAPLDGEIVAANGELDGSPELVNEDPYGSWIFRLRPSDPAQMAQLLDAAGYARSVGEE